MTDYAYSLAVLILLAICLLLSAGNPDILDAIIAHLMPETACVKSAVP